MKHIFTILCFVFTFTLSAQEICNNGIDDDGDLLIDLNDTVDCSCAAGTPPPVVSIIPNPSFEQRTCCPSSYGYFNCVSTWSAAATTTPDYLNQCNYVSNPVNAAGLNPFPDGAGCVGALFNSDYKEYITSCLNTPMAAGQEYKLKFYVASIITDWHLNNSICGFNNNLGAIDLTIYGSASCSSLTPAVAAPNGCIADTTWKVLGSVTYTPMSSWSLIAITFTPATNVNAIALGSPCNLPATYPPFVANGNSCNPYFLFDNLTLNTSDKVSLVDIKSTGHYCTNNLVLKANVVTTISSGATLQWYHDGVAIIGQTSTTYSVPPGITEVGNYQVQVSNGGSCVLSPIQQVTSTPPLISVYNPTICPSANFNLLATCPVITTFTWNTGAVSNTLAVNPNTTTVYTVSGTYGSCLVQNTPTVTVNFGLSNPLSITASTLNTCPGSTVQLTSHNAVGSVFWSDGGHGYLSGGTTQSVTVKPYSTVVYTLTSNFSNPLSGGASCQARAVITISVIPTSVSVTPNNIKICAGRSITLTATGASSYTWSNGASSNTTIVTPTVNTTYTVTGNDGVCTVTNTAFIRADSVISVSIGFDDYPCAGAPSTLYGYGATSYTWSNGATGSQAVISPTAATTYSVVGSAGYCRSQYSVSVNVFDPALVSVSGNTQVCSGQTSTLTVTSPGSVTVGYYTLESPASPISYFHAGKTYVTPGVTSTYTITSYINGMTCAPVSVITVSVVSQPVVSVNSPTICAGEPAVLLATGASGYTWNTGATTPTLSVAPVITTTFNVTGSTPGCVSSAVQTSTVFVNPLPTVSLNDIPVLCSDSPPYILPGSPANGTYTGNGVVSNSSFDPSVSGTGTFVVNYSYTDVNGCSNSATQTVTVSICTGIMELETQAISISPNPARSTLSISTKIEYYSIKITNLIGEIIKTIENNSGSISVSDLSNGVYFIQFFDKNDRILKTGKFIKN